MCGRSSLFASSSVIGERFDVSPPGAFEPSYNIAPEDDIPVIRDETPGRAELRSWGFVPHWADDPGDWNGLINARTETVDEKPAFRDAFRRTEDDGVTRTCGHCLVLADGFYEWQERTDGKQAFRIERSDGEPFAMAGLWSRWSDGDHSLVTVTVLTTTPNDLMEPLHHRMPVVFDADEEREWLGESPPGKEELLAPHSGDGFEKYPISADVNNPRNDSPDIIEPVDAPESDPQTGLDQF
ncbi:SOS response-associated peptidase [Natronoarchaeum sp. GCM10025703]|uniref:SOS response-associated peptidase n=1 Tax=unclassified Natronoarchaeum TaxID=2620183 RepID=UPI0036183420